jgi:hypothetical protein
MDKRYIKDLEGYMAIPEITKILGLSRARIHQLIDEDKFDLDDLRVVGDKRMIIIKTPAVYSHLRKQENRIEAALIHRQEEAARVAAREARAKVIAEARAELDKVATLAEVEVMPMSVMSSDSTVVEAEKLARERAAENLVSQV